MTDWNFGDIFEALAAEFPERPAHIIGDRSISWGDFDRRCNALTNDMIDADLQHQSKVAAYLHNGPEYMEVYVASFKGGLVPVNTNFRYGPEEIKYLWDNADAEIVVFHATYAPVIARVRASLPQVKRWYVVDDGSPLPEWAVPYEEVVAEGADLTKLEWQRSGDDLLFLYTGGTTGMPKGVMWRQNDLFHVLGSGGDESAGIAPANDLSELAARATQKEATFLPACPLMHGTGQFGTFVSMWLGDTVMYLQEKSFSPEELWYLVDQHKIAAIGIVGDAFARPMLGYLQANPSRFDLSSVAAIYSSGVMWSQETKDGLLAFMPQVALCDAYASSEAIGMGGSLSTSQGSSKTAAFMIGDNVKVFNDDDVEVTPGSNEAGKVALAGFLPQGYYKDEEKTAATFRTIAGVRYSLPGDYAQIAVDGSIKLLGRGSVCINTGGEKVFPEEVEEILKRYPNIHDAVCVGVPNERFGQAVCAIVEAESGKPELAEVSSFVGEHLADYKIPRHLVLIESIGRAPNGKVDYKRLAQLAVDKLNSG